MTDSGHTCIVGIADFLELFRVGCTTQPTLGHMTSGEGPYSTARMKKNIEVSTLIERTDWGLVMNVCKIAARKRFDETKWKQLGGYLILTDQARLLARITFKMTGVRPSLRRLLGATVARDGRWFCEAFSEIYEQMENAL